MEIEKHINNLKDYIRIDKENIAYDDSDFSQFCRNHCEDIQAILDELERIKSIDCYKLFEDYETGQLIEKIKIEEELKKLDKEYKEIENNYTEEQLDEYEVEEDDYVQMKSIMKAKMTLKELLIKE